MSVLLDKIVAAAGGKTLAVVRVPEWDAELRFRALTPSLRAQIRKGIDPKATEELYCSTLVHLAVDADGKAVFDTDPKTRAKLMATVDMGVLMRVLWEAGAEADPRQALLEGAEDAQIVQLLAQIGGADLGLLADLPEDVIAAIRALAMAPAHKIEEALGKDPERPDGKVTAAKNA